jgi:hypothetical protein
MKSRDRNTSFFHNFATARKKRNFIKKPVDDDGKEVEGRDNLAGRISNQQSETTCFSRDEYMRVLAPYTHDEVKNVLINIRDFKAPRRWTPCNFIQEILRLDWRGFNRKKCSRLLIRGLFPMIGTTPPLF